jgi:hypothetical protein
VGDISSILQRPKPRRGDIDLAEINTHPTATLKGWNIFAFIRVELYTYDVVKDF